MKKNNFSSLGVYNNGHLGGDVYLNNNIIIGIYFKMLTLRKVCLSYTYTYKCR